MSNVWSRCAGLWYVGDHGFLLRAPGGRSAVLASHRQCAEIAAVTRELDHELRSVPGVRLECKDATLAVHYRGASTRSRALAARAVSAIIRRFPHLRLLEGKKVWELLPAADVDKARVVRFILRWERRRAPAAHWLAIYIGDDIADERVFAGWHGLSVKVGRLRPTGARYYVRSPAEVFAFLARLRLSGAPHS
jgi:trehalose 6-phosphate phosphatase